MWRFLFGIGLLALLLGIGLYSAHAIDKGLEPIAITLEQASQAAAPEAKVLLEQARGEWERRWHGTAALADHSPMDEIDSLFALLEKYADAGLTGEFAAHCSRIAQLISAVGGAHSFNWWNLL